MEEATATTYWCHMCSQGVNPTMEVEIKCPVCQGGFVEEISSATVDSQVHGHESDFRSDQSLSLWAPVLLGMMGDHRRRRTLRHFEFEDEDDDNEGSESRDEGDTELDQEIESIIRRRRRNSATILQLLQNIRDGMASEYEHNDRDRDGNLEGDREREHMVLINPFNHTIIEGTSRDPSHNSSTLSSLGDYFTGPGLDMLLQHLAENDPNRYGTPPAQKEAIEAMPSVEVKENLQCSVCLDDFEIGAEAKEMPCKHKFHGVCIYPWLELHSSCPVCRFEIPADDSKQHDTVDTNSSGNGAERIDMSEDGGSVEDDDGIRFSMRWPFHGLFSASSQSQSHSLSSPSEHQGNHRTPQGD